MGRVKNMRFAGKQFSTKKDMKRFLDSIRLSGEISAHDYPVVEAILKQHPYWDEKSLGRPIKNIQIGIIEGNPCFFLDRFDGTKIDISGRYAIQMTGRKKPKNYWSSKDYTDAFRFEIRDQIMEYKKINNVPNEMELDHVRFFCELLETFLKNNDLEMSKLKLIDHGGHRTLHDRKIAESWMVFHQENATYQVLTKEQNSKRKPS